jgi:ATP-binding cassette, subfamily B, bacterial PglK
LEARSFITRTTMTSRSVASADITALLTELWHHTSRRRRQQFILLLGLMVVSGFAEVISLGAVLPFLGALTSPERVLNHRILGHFLRTLGVTASNELVLPLTVAFGATALAAGAIRLLLLWLSTRFVFAAGADLSIEMYRRTLYQPYQVHVARNSSEVISAIRSKTNSVLFGVLQPALVLASSLVVLIAVMFALLVIDYSAAIIAVASFGVSYGLVTLLSRHQLQRNGRRIAYEDTQVLQSLQEGLGGIRNVLLDGTQVFYCNIYREADRALKRALGDNIFIGGSPRSIMETLGVVLIAIMAYGLSHQSDGVATALPVLGALALGAERLLPALQQSYSSWASIVGTQASLADVLQMMKQSLPAESHQPDPPPLSFQHAIVFDNVCFHYGTDGPWVLDHISFTIPKGARVGFIGRTGSGKSTLLDLLMGLLEPNEGQVVVDGQPITGGRRRAWQQTLAHVPQNIYLADASLAENIAFGVPREAIDLDRVRQAARQAQIAEFIESRPEGYGAFVGERGVRLSGGQRQRIGIARALYKQAQILVFDEATSALDNTTEKAVMDAIESVNREITILIIAHRLSTVERCDTIIELKRGQVSVPA